MEHERKPSLTAMASKEEGSVLNADDLKLAEMGYKPVISSFSMGTRNLTMRRNYQEASP
jgi:hypothetical protein